MEFIETSFFTRYVSEYLSEDQYRALQWRLYHFPEEGRLIPASGGLRKLRWPGSGRGKRGGIRVIYYYLTQNRQIHLLTIYGKNEMDDLPKKALEKIRRELVDNG